MRRLASLLVCVVLVLSPSVAQAYSDTGWDPADRPRPADPDIEFSTREVFSLRGTRFLKIDLDAYEELSDWWRTLVGLDTRGGPGIDYWMQFGNYDTGGTECKVWKRRSDEDSATKGNFRQSGDKASCRVRVTLVRSTKEIRWFLRSPSMHNGKVDRAPDVGWNG